MNKAETELAHMWADTNVEAVGVCLALIVALEDRDTWMRVATWNGSQKQPFPAVASLLRATDNGGCSSADSK